MSTILDRKIISLEPSHSAGKYDILDGNMGKQAPSDPETLRAGGKVSSPPHRTEIKHLRLKTKQNEERSMKNKMDNRYDRDQKRKI